MKPLEAWTCQRAENLKKKSSKIPINKYAATMVSAARRQIIGGGAPINKSRRRGPQIVGGGGAARPAHGSSSRCRLCRSQTFEQLNSQITSLLRHCDPLSVRQSRNDTHPMTSSYRIA